MTSPTPTEEATMPDEVKLRAVEQLAEHLCARRPCGDTPENVADWLDYSLNKCGLVVIRTNAPSDVVEIIGHIIEDELFPIFGAGPYEATAAKVAAALSASGNADVWQGIERLRYIIRQHVNPFEVGPEDHALVLAIGTDDEAGFLAALTAPPAEGEGE